MRCFHIPDSFHSVVEEVKDICQYRLNGASEQVFVLVDNTVLVFKLDSMALILPQEIIDYIIVILLGLSSLRSCSLVSKLFSYRSRYHLFGDIIIYAEEDELVQSFLNILISKQAIAGCTLSSNPSR